MNEFVGKGVGFIHLMTDVPEETWSSLYQNLEVFRKVEVRVTNRSPPQDHIQLSKQTFTIICVILIAICCLYEIHMF